MADSSRHAFQSVYWTTKLLLDGVITPIPTNFKFPSGDASLVRAAIDAILIGTGSGEHADELRCPCPSAKAAHQCHHILAKSTRKGALADIQYVLASFPPSRALGDCATSVFGCSACRLNFQVTTLVIEHANPTAAAGLFKSRLAFPPQQH